MLKFYLMYLRRQKGGELDDAERASAVARVTRIVDVIDRILIIWFKFLLWVFIILFAATVITLCVSHFGTVPESAWVASIERWSIDAITRIIGEFGIAKSLSILALSLGVCVIVVYLILMLFSKKKRE